jgi:hypothetical protein
MATLPYVDDAPRQQSMRSHRLLLWSTILLDQQGETTPSDSVIFQDGTHRASEVIDLDNVYAL